MPSFNPFGGMTGRTSAALFEIRLENDVIVLRGPESEAASQILKGVVVLCLPSALRVEDVHLRMTGNCRISWHEQRLNAGGISTNRADQSHEIFKHEWAPFVGGGSSSSSRGTTLPAGNYEWPFELVIPGSMAESVEGLPNSHIVYKLKATVARGKLAYDLHAWKAVRIVRTLEPAALELAHAMTVENVWPNKIEYQLMIPQKAVIFGTAIDVEMRFTSLLKGLKIGKITCTLVEYQDLSLPGAIAHIDRTWKHQRDIETWTFELNEEQNYHDVIDESGQDGYTMAERMPLPKKLSLCLQDVDAHRIRIRHKVKFNVALHNPDGHVSELRATLPVTIFISPNMPLSADGCLVDQTPFSSQSVDISSHAPPLYGEHVLDQLYADMDQSGLMTPVPQSGMNTPFYNQSHSGSSENLGSLDGIATENGVTPAALSHRLQNLDLNSTTRTTGVLRRQTGTFSGGSTPLNGLSEVTEEHGGTDTNNMSSSTPHSNPLSRRTSGEGTSNIASGTHTPEHIDYSDLGDLSKVPSYSTAVRTPVRGTSFADIVPTYNTATSGTTPPLLSSPSSPTSRLTFPSAGSTNQHSTENHNGLGSTQTRRSHLMHMGFASHHSSGDDDERRRIHMLRNRA